MPPDSLDHLLRGRGPAAAALVASGGVVFRARPAMGDECSCRIAALGQKQSLHLAQPRCPLRTKADIGGYSSKRIMQDQLIGGTTHPLRAQRMITLGGRPVPPSCWEA